jgi:hypothetical protein
MTFFEKIYTPRGFTFEKVRGVFPVGHCYGVVEKMGLVEWISM